MHYCVLSSDGGACDYVDVNSLSPLSLSLAVQGGAHSASNSDRRLTCLDLAVCIWKLNKSLASRSIDKGISLSSDESHVNSSLTVCKKKP